MFVHNLRLNGFALAASAILSILFQQFTFFLYPHWYLVALTLFVVFILDNQVSSHRQHRDDFTGYLLFSLSLKLLLVFAGIGTCAFFFKDKLPAFAAHMIGQFFIYTIFSIRFVYLLVNPAKK